MDSAWAERRCWLTRWNFTKKKSYGILPGKAVHLLTGLILKNHSDIWKGFMGVVKLLSGAVHISPPASEDLASSSGRTSLSGFSGFTPFSQKGRRGGIHVCCSCNPPPPLLWYRVRSGPVFPMRNVATCLYDDELEEKRCRDSRVVRSDNNNFGLE
jgi:hypothetical protein